MPNITSVEIKNGQRGPYKQVKMDEKVLGRDMFLVFNNHTRYEDVVEGRDFAVSEFSKDGEYIKLVDPDAGIKGKRGGASPVQIAAAQENKARFIEKAQDNKDRAIRLSGAMNHAVTVVTSFNKDLTPEEIKNKIINWRNWFLENWDVPEAEASETPF